MLWNDLQVVFMINESLIKLDQIEYDFFSHASQIEKIFPFWKSGNGTLDIMNWDTWYNEWCKK